MHLLHRSPVSGAGGGGKGNSSKAALRRVGSSPRAAPRTLMSRSESIKKRSGGTKKGSKRARLRAGLAAALQELRLAGRNKRRGGVSLSESDATTRRPGVEPAALRELRLAGRHERRRGVSLSETDATTRRPGVQVGGPSGSCSDAAAGSHEPSSGSVTAGALLPLLLLVLALACVVALGRAPAVCCCTCAAWWCRGSSGASADGRRRVLCSDVVRLRPQPGASVTY